jgi:hypothetical protein
MDTSFTNRNDNLTVHEDDNIVHKTDEDSLYNSKNYLTKYTGRNITFYERDILASEVGKNIRLSAQSLNHGKACNNVILTVDFITQSNHQNSKVELHKIINFIELSFGGIPYDKISGNFIETLLKYHNLNYTYENSKLTVPIPFHLFLNNSLIYLDKSKLCDLRLCIDINNLLPDFLVDKVSLTATYYSYDDGDINVNFPEYKKLHQLVLPITTTINTINKTDMHLTALFKQYQYDSYNLGSCMNFYHPSSNLFFLFTDKDDNIIIEKMFDYCCVSFNGLDVCENTYSEIKENTALVLGNFNGTYHMNLKNLKYVSHKQINLTHIRHQHLKFIGFPWTNLNEVTVHVCVINSNVLSYVDGSICCYYSS